MKGRFKEFRKALHMTQQELADGLGVAKSTIEAYEYGRVVDVPVRTLECLKNKYNLNVDWLKTGDGEMFVPKDRAQEIGEAMAKILNDPVKVELQNILAEMDENQMEWLLASAKRLLRAQEDKKNLSE